MVGGIVFCLIAWSRWKRRHFSDSKPTGTTTAIISRSVLRWPCTSVDAPTKEVRLAETQTVLKDEDPEQAIRTIV
jgi:hypothetical protein